MNQVEALKAFWSWRWRDQTNSGYTVGKRQS